MNVWLSGQAEEWVVGGSETEGWSQAFLQVTPESPLLQLECGPRNALCADVSLGVESGSALKSHGSGLTGAPLPGFSEVLLEDALLPLIQDCRLLFSGGKGSLRTSLVQSLSGVFVTPWTTACQASLSITNSWSLLKLMSIGSVMPSNHLILCRPLLLPPSIFPSIRVFSSESTLPIKWPKYWSFSFNIGPSSGHPGLISFRMDWLELLAVQGTLKSLQHTVQKHPFFSAQLSLESNSHIHT